MVEDHLNSTQIAEHIHNIELILGCGDWPYEYMEFLVPSWSVPLLYVPGKQDPAYDRK